MEKDDGFESPDEAPPLNYLASEDFRSKEKNRKEKGKGKGTDLLVPGGDDRSDDSSSCGSKNSKYATAIQTKDGKTREDYIFKPKRVITYETYLEKSNEAPKYLNSPKFLSKNVFEKVAMPSYQSSGSTLLRKYIENITCILTGSDGDTHSKLDRQLKEESKLLGEGILGTKVWIAQTNFPEEIGVARLFINKAIVVTRNPCDAIFSLFNKLCTKDINKKLSSEKMEDLNDCWTEFVKNEIDIWKQFHDYWMLEPVVPTYIVRYEDLLKNPKNVLTSVFKFLLNTRSLSKTLIKTLIEKETAEDNENYYSQNKPGYSFEWFSPELTSYMEQRAGCVIRRLGYGADFITPINPIAETGFFENDDDFEASKELELDTIVKNTTEYVVKMRYNYTELNSNQMEIVDNEEYQNKVDVGDIPSFEINLEAEDLRIRGDKDYRFKKILGKYKDIIKS
ncbi:unnamed protein product [Moneuplotes crassus]|uniref:Sulfotransferase domain-containing protein n=1 Tax=Euplotes crassus TaxID=5936 RepID=A0AAD1XB42_EUPCR|nr:unnamed protein product [Moneuplotes crassus]